MTQQRIKPQILPDASKHWPARTLWSFDYLKKRIGDKPAYISNQQITSGSRNLTIGDYIDSVTHPNPPAGLPYLHAASIPSRYPEIYADVQPALECTLPNFMSSRLLPWQRFGYPEGRLGFPELLIGAPGAGIPELHYDIGFEHAFITQLIGDKDFFVFPPEDGDKLYPRANAPCQSSIVDVENPDLEQFPLFRQADMQRISLLEGQTLFIPSGWWHISKSMTPGVAVSYNSVSAANWNAFANCKLAQVHSPLKKTLLGINLTATGAALKILERLTSKHRAIY